jgi:hypothetical protein
MTKSREETYWTDIESTTKEAVADLEARCRTILETAKIPEEEREPFERALLNFRRGFDELTWTVEPMRERYPMQLRTVYQMLFVSMRTAMQLGASHLFTDAARDFYKTEQKREAGKKSGESRLAKRPWVKHARELAMEIRTANPKSSQDDVATEIMARWKGRGENRHPGHPTLKKFLSELEAAGVIPRRS